MGLVLRQPALNPKLVFFCAFISLDTFWGDPHGTLGRWFHTYTFRMTWQVHKLHSTNAQSRKVDFFEFSNEGRFRRHNLRAYSCQPLLTESVSYGSTGNAWSPQRITRIHDFPSLGSLMQTIVSSGTSSQVIRSHSARERSEGFVR